MGSVTLNPRLDQSPALVELGTRQSRVPDMLFDGTDVGFNYDGRGHLDLDAIVRAARDGDDVWRDLSGVVEGVRHKSIDDLRRDRELAAMQDLVEQLLFLARGDSGRNTMKRVDVNLAQVTTDVWEESLMIDSSHVYVLGFDERCRDDARYLVTGDATMLKQSIRIVVQNAAKYSPAGTTITFGVEQTNGGAACSVTDEGIGMLRTLPHRALQKTSLACSRRIQPEEGRTV